MRSRNPRGVEAAIAKIFFPRPPKSITRATSRSARTARRTAATRPGRGWIHGRWPGRICFWAARVWCSTTSSSCGRRNERTATSPLPSSRATPAGRDYLRGLKYAGRRVYLQAAEARGPARFQPGDAQVDRPVRALAAEGESAEHAGARLLHPHGGGNLRRRRFSAVAAGAACLDRSGREVPAEPEKPQRADRRLGVLHRSAAAVRLGTA